MIIHAADAHLGITRYSRIDPESGQNLRGKDFLDSFVKLCDDVVDRAPDLFLFSGDLFDRVNPTNHVRRVVQQQLMRISGASVDTVIISGNHETPRSRGVSNPLILYRDIPRVSVVLRPTRLEIGDYSIMAVPFTPHPHSHMGNPVGSKTNILMLHTTIEGASVGSERYMCFSDETLSRSQIPDYDYVALGHIHKMQDLSRDGRRILYPGSIERYDFNEMGEEKGYLVVDDEVEFVPLPSRRMESAVLDVSSLSGYEISQRCNEIIESCGIGESIFRIELSGELSQVDRNSINFASIREHAAGAAYFTIVDRTAQQGHEAVREEAVLFSPHAELERYLRMTDTYSDTIYAKGSSIIDRRMGQ